MSYKYNSEDNLHITYREGRWNNENIRRHFIRIYKAALASGISEESLNYPYLSNLQKQTKSARIMHMIQEAYYLGKLNGIAEVDEGLTPISFRDMEIEYNLFDDMSSEDREIEVLNFILRRFPIDCWWIKGNSFYFSSILNIAFPDGHIMYNTRYQRFVFLYDNVYYNWGGKMLLSDEEKAEYVLWDTMSTPEKDKILKTHCL